MPSMIGREDGFRPYGPTTIGQRHKSKCVTIIADARDAAGIEPDDEYHIVADLTTSEVRFVKSADVGAGELDLGEQTVKAYKSGTGSVYVLVPNDALAVLGADLGDDVELLAAESGEFALRPW